MVAEFTSTPNCDNHDDVARSLLYLSSVCDGANAEDGKGFNGADAEFGHNLASVVRSGKQLTPRQHYAAFTMLCKYRRQLKKAGIELRAKKDYVEVLEADRVTDTYTVYNRSKGTEYVVETDGLFAVNCNCQAAEWGNACDHLKFVDGLLEVHRNEQLAVDGIEKSDRPTWVNDSDPHTQPEKISLSLQAAIPNDNKQHYSPDVAQLREGLSVNQQEGFDLALRWYENSPSEPFVLRGYAGTGKTYLCQRIVKALRYLHPRTKTAICAPTHKAVHVLEQMAFEAGLSAHIATQHSLLHVKPGRYTKRGHSKLVDNPWSTEPHYSEFNLVVVDESSMIGGELFGYTPYTSVPTIFMGDPAQLPPVEQFSEDDSDESSAIGCKESPIFSLGTGIELTEVQRYEGAIAQFATELRSNLQAQFPPRLSTGGNLYKMDPGSWITIAGEMAEQALESNNPYLMRVLAWGNARVAEINSTIRKAIYGSHALKEGLLVGERLVAKEPIMGVSDLGYPKVIMPTCGECTVDNVRIASVDLRDIIAKVNPNFLMSEILDPLASTRIEAYQVEVTTDMGEREEFTIPHPHLADSWVILTNTAYKWKQAVLADNDNRGKAWAKYFQFLERLHLMAKRQLMTRFQYAFALTVHQSQGSTFNHVFVDMPNILACRSQTRTSQGDIWMRNQLLYTAATRAKDELLIASKF